MIEYKKTDRFCEYRNMHFADITEIYYNGWCVGGKFYDKWRTAGQIWYILECDVDFIPECEKKFGYGFLKIGGMPYILKMVLLVLSK